MGRALFGLAAGIAAGQVRIAEQAGGSVAEDHIGQVFACGRSSRRPEKLPRLALVAFAADDGGTGTTIDRPSSRWPFTADPTSTTSPIISWPMMSPGRMAGI